MLAVHCQKWKQRPCADNTSCRTFPARLPRTRQGGPCLARGISIALSSTRALSAAPQSFCMGSVPASLCPASPAAILKGSDVEKMLLKIEMQVQILTRVMGKIGTTKCPTKKTTYWSGPPTYLQMENYTGKKPKTLILETIIYRIIYVLVKQKTQSTLHEDLCTAFHLPLCDLGTSIPLSCPSLHPCPGCPEGLESSRD